MANNLGATPLLFGASDIAKAKMLVKAGADVNARTGTGPTPLIVAASVSGSAPTIKMLLEQGADWKAVDKMGINAMLASANTGNLEVMRMLADRGADVTYNPSPGAGALHFAAVNRDVPMLRYLLARGAKVDGVMNFGMPMRHGVIALDRITPLMLAATYGPVEAVRALLDAGADVNAKDVRGMTPLMFAVSSEVQDPTLVKMLLARGARAGERSKAGETPLDWARKFNRRPVLALLGDSSAMPINSSVERGEAVPASEAVGRAVKLLQRSQAEFFRQTGCIACHHSVTGAIATQAARTHGLAVDEAAADEFRKVAAAHAQGVAPMTLQLIDPPGAADTVMYALIGMEAAGIEPSPATDAYATYLFRLYRPGRNWWTGGIARAPLEDSGFHRTAVVVKALNRYLPPALAAEYKTVVEQIKASLRGDSAITTDDAAMKVLGVALHRRAGCRGPHRGQGA